MKIGTNTFGLGAAFRKNLNGALASLKESGITSVEPCILFPKGPAAAVSAFVVREMPVTGGIIPSASGGEMIRKLRDLGFTVCSIHAMGFSWKSGNIRQVLRFCRENGIRYAVVSPMEGSVAKIRRLLPKISAAVKEFRDNDIELLIHNHAGEWKESEGTTVMDLLAENVPELRFELDAGWTEFAGVSSVEAMRKFKDRIRLLHLKEIKKGTVDLGKPFCVAPGTGILPLAEVLQAAAGLDLDEDGILFDQDNSVDGDVLADLREGVKNVQTALLSL
jgi:sugar phosphate isomerase/epimerase